MAIQNGKQYIFIFFLIFLFIQMRRGLIYPSTPTPYIKYAILTLLQNQELKRVKLSN